MREVQSVAHPELSISTMLVDDVPVEALVRQSCDAALVVLGSHGAGGVRSLIAGSTTLAVAARAESTVVAVPAVAAEVLGPAGRADQPARGGTPQTRQRDDLGGWCRNIIARSAAEEKLDLAPPPA